MIKSWQIWHHEVDNEVYKEINLHVQWQKGQQIVNEKNAPELSQSSKQVSLKDSKSERSTN